MLASLGGKHGFESGMKARSWNMCLLGPTNDPICTHFASSFAVWNLQNPLEKFLFLVYGSFSEAIFSIVCFIAWLRSEIFIFLHRIWPNFWRMHAALGTSEAEAHAPHVSVTQHISKSIPFRYYSLQCKPSRFRPHAIAGFWLQASLRRSETACRA